MKMDKKFVHKQRSFFNNFLMMAAKRERKSSFAKKPEQRIPLKKSHRERERDHHHIIIMLANSWCAVAATGIHTQSNALVTSKIRARKTPKLIRSRVLSIAIAGKPVPPEVRKKIAHLCFTLIFFYL